MDQKVKAESGVDMEKFRLRRFVDRLIEHGHVTIHEEPVALADLSSIIEATPNTHLFRQAGPEQLEMVSTIGASRARLAMAFEVPEDRLIEEYARRMANPQPIVEVSSDEAPVHQVRITGQDVDLTKLPFHAQHENDGSVYISCGLDFSIDSATGLSNFGSRRLSLRNRYETGINVTAPSDLKAIYQACVARGERHPISFALGSGLLDFMASGLRIPCDEATLIGTMRGEPVPLVKCLTNDVWVTADAEMILEGYLWEKGYVEPEGPYGEYMGYYGPMHMDPIFHCTAITMRSDILYQTWLHGSAQVLHRVDGAMLWDLRGEGAILDALKGVVRAHESIKMNLCAGIPGQTRISFKQTRPGEVRAAMAAVFANISHTKHLFLYDDDVDIFDERQVGWAMSTRFQADRDMVVYEGLFGQRMDNSLDGRRDGVKAGFDCTVRFGRENSIMLKTARAQHFDHAPARFQTVEQALEKSDGLYFMELVAALGSDDGREIAAALDELRQLGKMGRDRFGRYHATQAAKGTTGIVGDLDHDPND